MAGLARHPLVPQCPLGHAAWRDFDAAAVKQQVDRRRLRSRELEGRKGMSIRPVRSFAGVF
jgi:hypothetical protein